MSEVSRPLFDLWERVLRMPTPLLIASMTSSVMPSHQPRPRRLKGLFPFQRPPFASTLVRALGPKQPHDPPTHHSAARQVRVAPRGTRQVSVRCQHISCRLLRS